MRNSDESDFVSLWRCGRTYLIERDISDSVFLPVLVIEVPPLSFVDSEAFRFHLPAQQVAVPTLQRCAAGIIRVSAVGRLVVSADHLDRFTGPEIVESDIDCAPAVVSRTFRWIGDKLFLVVRSGVPK